MKHAYFGPGRAVPIPAVFRQPFVIPCSDKTLMLSPKRQAQAVQG